MEYRKKPVVVEAYKTDKEVVIHTLEGDMKASIGDYIITGVNGEQYPCKPDIFEKTYEAVTNTNYDRIKAMSVDEMADVILNSNDEICFAKCKAETGNGYSCKFGDNLDISNCKNCMKEWLESDVEGE